ncbi:MAG: nickel-dependent hydrogenase large subunit [Chloroflexota bacterium]|nr:nickel-dependent hydrogenase large subunit [Chloroflexota bacterium]
MTHGLPHDTESGERHFNVGQLTRVEGEGSLTLRVRNGAVVQAHLGIFEAPRYFERLVVGRTPDEVIDIVARICGICPVAYQMSAVHAFEALFGVTVDPQIRALRRLFYCGEWIESHALHIYLLHAPDFLGYPSAIELARDHRGLVEQALKLKRTGNQLVARLGARPIHPLTVRVGGFSRAPTRPELLALRPALDEAFDIAQATVDLVSGLNAPDFKREPRLVALRHPHEYPMNEGRIVSTDGLDIAIGSWRGAFAEDQVAWSNALQARTQAGEVYQLGPASRVTLNAARLHPLAAEALRRSGLAEEIRINPYWSIAARAVELVHAVAEARDIIDSYVPPVRPFVPWQPRAGSAGWATEAPRGLLFHHYEIDERGLVASAQIVPPTSQNQAAIEADLTAFAPSVLGLPHAEATLRLEQLIRSYDPCISCATHFLDVHVEEEGDR